MKRESKKLVMENGLLHRLSQSHSKEKICQLVLSAEFRPVVRKSMHDDQGHLGAETTTNMIRSCFYWPKMSADVKQYTKTVESAF